MTDDRTWTPGKRLMWRFQFAALVIAVVSGLLAGLGYLMTRASVDSVAALDEKKADKAEIQRLDNRVDSLNSLTHNVRDNLIVLMAKQKAEPVPLPVAPLTQPLAPAVRP